MKTAEITAGRSRAVILDYGATLACLEIWDGARSRNVVLSLQELDDYPRHGAFFGAIAGRCANRIAGGKLHVGGRDHQLSLNENGRTHLHGGSTGFWSRQWTIAASGKDSVTLTLASPDGEDGYPGNVEVKCTYRFMGEHQLSIELEATTDRQTIVNLATHSYFNLGNGPDVLGHTLEIPSARLCPVDDELVPTGAILDGAGSGFDFRHGAKIGANRAKTQSGFDINYAVYDQPSAEVRLMARLQAGDHPLAMEIHSTEPGLQFYDGQYLPIAVAVKDARNVRFGGCCLEPQRYPDAVHHPHFPGVWLSPGELYHQRTEYIFSLG